MVELGEEFSQGDRLLELDVDGATVRIVSPAAGKLAEIWVEEEEPVNVGQLVAVVIGEKVPGACLETGSNNPAESFPGGRFARARLQRRLTAPVPACPTGWGRTETETRCPR